jgi:hypothetical protein
MKKKVLLISLVVCVILSALLVSCAGKEDVDMMPTNPNYNSSMGDANMEIGKDAVGDSVYVDSQKVVKNASVTAETKNYAEATDKLKALISTNGVVIASSNTKVEASYYSSDDMLRNANYVLKVPADKFDAFIDGLGEFLNITYITTSTEDVSDMYYDLEAVIETLNAKRDSLLEMLNATDSKTNFSYWKQLTEELTEIETQIARYEAQMKALSGRVNYSTVTLSLREVGELTATEEKTYGAELWEAVKDGLVFILEFFKVVLIVAIYLLPFAFVGGVVFLIIFLSVRHSKKKRISRRGRDSASDNSNN